MTELNNVIKSIKCPKAEEKVGISAAMNIWIPSFTKYAFNYTGLSITNKSKKKNTLGRNYFVQLGEKKCDNSSKNGCSGEVQYMYNKEYPIGRLPKCVKKADGTFKTSWDKKIFGSTGILGGIQEDIYNLNGTDFMKSMIGKGPYSSEKCMRSTLPVGSHMLDNSKKKSKKKAEKDGNGWWEETHCISYQPTVRKKYGSKIYNIPFSSSFCKKKERIETFLTQKSENKIAKNTSIIFLFFIMIIIICYFYTTKMK
jgi:hypothetical protein